MMPPEAITGTSGPTASTTCGTSASVPTSAGAAGPEAPPTPNVPRWPPASPPCVITADAPQGDGAPRLADRRDERQQVRSGGLRRLGHGRGIVERRDHLGPCLERRLDQGDRGVARDGLRRLVGQPQLPPERPQHLEDALALARRRRRLRELHVDADRACGCELARSRDVAHERLGPHARGAEHAQAARARHGGHQLGRARAVRHARQQDRQPDSQQVAERRAQIAHTSLEPAQRLMSPSVA